MARRRARSKGMSERISTVVLVVRDGTSPRRASEIRRWIRALVPAAMILVSSVPLDLPPSDDVVTVLADDVEAGPLSVADALTRRRAPGPAAPAVPLFPLRRR
jgi:hypothetical protein